MDPRLVRDHALDQRSPQACARALCLVTVADAQGLSDDAAPSLCPRFALTRPALHEARQALIMRGVVASHHPLSQVFALDVAPRGAAPSAAPGADADAPVDIQAVFARIWAGLG